MRFRNSCPGRFQSAISAAAFLILMVVSAASPASAATCTNASFKGVYGLFTSGFYQAEAVGDVGQLTASGTGTLTGSVTRALYGVITNSSISGTYSVGKTCTGTLTYKQGTATYNYSIDLNSANKAFQVIETDLGYSVVGFIQPLGTATCGLSGKTSSYALNGFGGDVGVGPTAYGGQLTLDGKGNVTGTIDISTSGTITTGVAVTGTYTQGTDCIGTLVLNPTGFAAIDFNTYAVNSDKEWLMIDTVGGFTLGANIQ